MTKNVILKGLTRTRNTFEIFLTLGKAVYITYDDLKDNEILDIDGIPLPHDMIKDLINEARLARRLSYAPYSHFNVGAAIWTFPYRRDQLEYSKIFRGCNVENAAYGSTMCAERVASFNAVSSGYRSFRAIAIVGDFDASVEEDSREAARMMVVSPCGACRQVLNEFGGENLGIIMASENGDVYITLLRYLLPESFGPENLGMSPSDYSRYE